MVGLAVDSERMPPNKIFHAFALTTTPRKRKRKSKASIACAPHACTVAKAASGVRQNPLNIALQMVGVKQKKKVMRLSFAGEKARRQHQARCRYDPFRPASTFGDKQLGGRLGNNSRSEVEIRHKFRTQRRAMFIALHPRNLALRLATDRYVWGGGFIPCPVLCRPTARGTSSPIRPTEQDVTKETLSTAGVVIDETKATTP